MSTLSNKSSRVANKISSSAILSGIKQYLIMTLGMFFYAFGWIGCIIPTGGIGGGATGVSVIICAALKSHGISIEIGTVVLIVNAILLLIAGFVVGWKFGIKTIYCIFMVSMAMNFWEWLLAGRDIIQLDERILKIFLGAIFAGLGVSMCFKQGGSTGGTDIAAVIIQKYRNIPYSKILIYSDFAIIGSSLLVGMSLSTVIYGYLFTAAFGYMVDMMMAGNHQSSQIQIIAKDYELMANTIMQSAHRGVTLIDSQGWYTREPSKMVMVVCRKRETSTILKIVREVDPNAFITVGPVMGAYGQGFEELKKL